MNSLQAYFTENFKLSLIHLNLVFILLFETEIPMWWFADKKLYP